MCFNDDAPTSWFPTNSACAVVVTFSFDPQVSVILMNDENEAWEFIKTDILEEYNIDTQENGWESEYAIYEDDHRAVLTTHFKDRDDIVEWRIGDIYVKPGWHL